MGGGRRPGLVAVAALHYRWSYPADALLLSRRIVDELMGPIPLLAALKRFLIRRRQVRRSVRGDGPCRQHRDPGIRRESRFLRRVIGQSFGVVGFGALALQDVVRFLVPYTKAGWAFAVLSPRTR